MAFIVFNALFMLAFVLSALVQFNDPDAGPWIALYLAAAAMCVAAWRGSLARPAAWLLLVICAVWIATLLPALGPVSLSEIFESVSMRTQAVEEAREIGGLALVVSWSAVLATRRRTAS